MLAYSSSYDESNEGEGTIDPLGLSNIAERLAGKLVPGVRERMKHPRFLTAMAAGAYLMQSLDDMDTGSDIEPFLVYEWILVQAWYDTFHAEENALKGLPGLSKAKDACKLKERLCERNYLKNAYTFGFHGVYRTLAEELDVIRNNEPGSNGIKLLQIWEQEQRLDGFTGVSGGNGAQWRNKLLSAVKMGIKKGEVPYPWGWNGFNEFAHPFAPLKPGKREKEFLGTLLRNDSKGYRVEIWNHLPKYLTATATEHISEKGFHVFLLKEKISQELKVLLKCIKAYEAFCRLLDNAFYAVLHYLTKRKKKTSILQLAKEVNELPAATAISSAYEEAVHHFSDIPEGEIFQKEFEPFSHITSQEELVDVIFRHHQKVQAKKPPSGKLPWVDDFDGDLMIRPSYLQDSVSVDGDEYVNAYRLGAMTQFYEDLKGKPWQKRK